MSDGEYTLDDLERLTGFNKRQIRFYITKKLAPGAGEKRGPYAVYGRETMVKLRAIAHLKDMRVPPAGRTMSLEEIGAALDSYSVVELEALVEGHASLKAFDTDEVMMRKSLIDESAVEETSASEYLKSVRPQFEADQRRRPASAPRGAPMRRREKAERGPVPDVQPMLFSAHAVDPPEQEMRDLLSRLQALLHELGRSSRHITRDGMDQWQRVGSDDIEINVRQPNDHRAKARLAVMARALAEFLEGEDEA